MFLENKLEISKESNSSIESVHLDTFQSSFLELQPN